MIQYGYGVTSVNGMDTIVDLMLLEIVDFDVILGMDCVSFLSCYSGLHAKVVKV